MLGFPDGGQVYPCYVIEHGLRVGVLSSEYLIMLVSEHAGV